MIPDVTDTQQIFAPIDPMLATPDRISGSFSRIMHIKPIFDVDFVLECNNPRWFALIGEGGIGKTALLSSILRHIGERDSELETPVFNPPFFNLPQIIGSDLSVAKELQELVAQLLGSNLFIEYLKKQPYSAEKALLKLFALCKRIAATIAKLRLLLFVQYMFNRRFRSGRRSRRLLLHHAYQICYLSLSVLLNEFCLAKPSGVRERRMLR